VNKTFSDHFSPVASHYADNRPTYPAALFDWLANQCKEHTLAWDCGAGNGQASTELARYFDRVVATDASAEQISQAIPHPFVEYRVALSENCGLDDSCADLIVAAQSLHWFELDRFYAEVLRVLKPEGLLAVWSYGVLKVEGKEVDEIVQHFYYKEVGPYWPSERHHVETAYREIDFPFLRVSTPTFTMKARWSLVQLLGYFRSWSATARFIKDNDFDPVKRIEEKLLTSWGDANQVRTIEWPLAVLLGKSL
jgi:ubiquinone/menaquinone biosynthesis C-methylase UbiE